MRKHGLHLILVGAGAVIAFGVAFVVGRDSGSPTAATTTTPETTIPTTTLPPTRATIQLASTSGDAPLPAAVAVVHRATPPSPASPAPTHAYIPPPTPVQASTPPPAPSAPKTTVIIPVPTG